MAQNKLASTTNAGSMYHDPLRRLYVLGREQLNLSYDGDELIAEHPVSVPGTVLRRYVHGPGTDEPLVWYEGSGTTDRRWFHQDERGSVIATSNGSGGVIATYTYDEYGIPGSNDPPRFGYTGQMWLPYGRLYHYKARTYSPTLGRFLQPDPIGYGDGMNAYQYVRADPVNFTDPSGKCMLWANVVKKWVDAIGGYGPWETESTFKEGDCDSASLRKNSLLGFLDRNALSHDYGFSTPATKPATKCTEAQVKAAMSMFAVPGNDFTKVKDGQRYTVSQAVPVPLLSGVFANVPVGTVRVSVTNGGRTITNETVPPHIFHDGSVQFQLSGNQRSGFSIGLRGTGTNYTVGLAIANQVGGAMIFANQIAKMQGYLKGKCGG